MNPFRRTIAPAPPARVPRMSLRLALVGVLLAVCALPPAAARPAPPPPAAARSADAPAGIIFFICDGMGPGCLPVIRNHLRGRGLPFEIDELAATARMAMVYTEPGCGELVTDSSSAGTALATGVDTRNGYLGTDEHGRPLSTILEELRDRGWKTGLVTTTSLTHATPAAFYAHVPPGSSPIKNPPRDEEARIAEQFVASGIDLALGGGIAQFQPKTLPAVPTIPMAEALRTSRRPDERNLLAELLGRGVQVVARPEGLRKFDPARPLVGLFAPSHLAFEIDLSRHPHCPSFETLVDAALRYMEAQPAPFFLMIEAGRIDHAAHGNDPIALLHELAAMNRALARVRRHLAARPETLLVFTSDHDTGSPAYCYRIADPSHDRDAAEGVEVYPGRREQETLYRQTASIMQLSDGLAQLAPAEVFDRFRRALGIPLPPAEIAAIAGNLLPDNAYFKLNERYGIFRNSVAFSYHHRRAFGISWNSAFHTSTPVPLFAQGPGADRFSGLLENERIPWILRELVGLPVAGHPNLDGVKRPTRRFAPARKR